MWNNAKSTLLAYQEETKQPRRLFEPFQFLEFSPPLESCSDIDAGPTSCLIETLLFNVLSLQYFPLFYLPVLSIVDLLIFVLCTLFSLSFQDTPPYCWLVASVCFGTWHCGQNCFSKLLSVPLNVNTMEKLNFQGFIQCSHFWSGNVWKLWYLYLCILNLMFAYLNTAFQKTRNAAKLS